MSCIILLLQFFLFSLVLAEPCNTLFYPEACPTNQITFERHSFSDNLRKEVATYVRGHSSESIIIHVLFIFTDQVNHYHNALLFNPQSLEKYQKILRESEFPFNNELMIVTKGREMVVQYDIAGPEHSHYFDSSGRYDAVLSLDYYASLWHEYNSIVVERSRLSLLMRDPPFHHQDITDGDEYMGSYTLWCNKNVSVKRCHVILPPSFIGNLPINGDKIFNVSGIIIDTSRTTNLLPYDLFVRWKYHEEKELSIAGENDTTFLYLNLQFNYEINHESLDIILGTDFLTLFQKAEYCMEAGYYRVWFNHLYQNQEAHNIHVTILCLFVSTLLSIFFYWVTSVNYNIQDSILQRERNLSFPYFIVISELMAYLIGVTLAILTLIFVDHLNILSNDHKKRTLLFLVTLIYHVVIGVGYLTLTNRKLTKQALSYYYHYYGRQFNVKSNVNDPLIVTTMTSSTKIKHRHVLIRNLTLNTVTAMSLLLIFNYLAEDRPLYLVVVMIISSTAMYYYVKMFSIALQYLSLRYRPLWSHYNDVKFVTLLTLSLAGFIVYFVMALSLIYMSFLHEFNSMYSEVFLWIFTIHLNTLIIIFATGIVFMITVKHFISKQQKNKVD